MTDLSLVASTVQGRLDFLQRQLFAINQATAAAKARGDEAALEILRSNFRSVYAQVQALKGDAQAADMPSAFMLTLANFSAEVDKVGTALGGAAVTVLGGLGDLAKWLPWILAGAVIVVGLIYAGKLGKDLRK